ncbi:cytochrome c biogenesis protein ResB [Luteolibacter luteus]|uniref:Cytochrome c biogenesis protein ResB n=1 Tax=Luteolibacter luteus TaxID=2728835 RepID=A0A858RE54_9BACT|nr:cytochrome c biogenesis protein ResB [Luteolibacter luteus]QJE95022.1 cytochrome c biogenesis protein ResB [Luteolibacter luteus]
MSSSGSKSIPLRILNFFSGLGLATVLLVILMILTWVATLEQVLYGLHATLEKYFTPKASGLFVFPDAGIISEGLTGKKLPPLPGGYWVCALLVLNLTLGGIIRMRKGWNKIGILMSHFGIIFMIVAGGVAQLKEERGVMMLSETEGSAFPKTADYAQAFTETTVEITEVKDGKLVGPVHFVKDVYYRDLEGADRRVVRLPKLPFDLEFQGYVQNAKPMAATAMAPTRNEPIVDGWYLFGREPNKETEMDTPGVHARVLGRDGKNGDGFLLAVESHAPYTVTADGRTFTVSIDKRVWPVPFQVRLEDARSEYHPNTTRPKVFESDIVRIEDGRESKVFIEMNEPMRYAGYTFFQRTMMNGPSGGAKEATISGFEVVRNPADKWPEYSIYVVGLGLCVHFLTKLWGFLFRKKSNPVPQA